MKYFTDRELRIIAVTVGVMAMVLVWAITIMTTPYIGN